MSGGGGVSYTGRFAPSPTGPLHFGSLVAAVGSYLDARAHGGRWLLRIEDLDMPRTVPGAADAILRCLEACGLQWDGPVLYQSRRIDAYHSALARLARQSAVYDCTCTRREIADSALAGIDGPVYPGTCRDGLPGRAAPAGHAAPAGRAARAVRLRTQGARIRYTDAIQGDIVQDVEHEVGDFVVARADGVIAYQLAVVIDDDAQGITDVVRGADLLDSTPRQIWLQRVLGLSQPGLSQPGLPQPRYAHLPVAVNAQGEKLSKQTRAAAIDITQPAPAWLAALRFLGQAPPPALENTGVHAIHDWALANWQRGRIPRRRALTP